MSTLTRFAFLLACLVSCVLSTFSQQAVAPPVPQATQPPAVGGTPAGNPAPPAEDLCAPLKKRVEQMDRTLHDWPNLQRYGQANVTLGPPAREEKRVVFMGDSITDMWKLEQYFPAKPYVNRGIGGQTTPQMLIRFRPEVVDLQPKVVVILAGTNDIAGNTGPMTLQQTEENLASMAELARAHDIKVVLSSLLPVSNYAQRDFTIDRPPEKIVELNLWIRQYCKDHKLVYLDYFSHTVDAKGMLTAELSDDGLHPNAAGYKVMAPLAEQAIAQALR